MATERVLKQMAEFDFSKPIKVEIIFEDSDDDKPSLQSSLSEQQKLNDNNNNKQVPVENSKTNSNKHDEIFENQNNNKSLNKSMLSLNSRILQRKPSKEISQDDNAQNLNNSKDAEKTKNPNDIEYNQNTLVANRHTLDFIDNNTINVEERLGNTRQNNEHQEPATFIEDLLNKLSEHIFLIMQSFHHYGMKIPNKDNKKREEVYNFIKSHFYELSYSTVESIILPQEQNVSFINKFLDNTVLIVNNKSSQWKCNRGHVLPFFTELMTWTKRKRESIQNNPPSSTSNENILLKQQLVRPLLPVNLPQSEIVANSNVESQKTQSNLCIFSSGPPGKEISINIDSNTLNQINGRQQLIGDSNTLNQINERQQLTGKEAKQTGINNNSTERVESTRRKTSVARAPCRNRVKYVQNNNPQYDRPPPAYDSIYNTGRIPYTMPQQYSHNPPTHAGQPHQNHPSTGQHNHSNQVHYVNTNRTLPPPVLQNYLYDNTNNNNPMYRTQIETQDTSNPVIRNVSSLNPNTRVLMYRCCMCGKKTMSPCNPYNPCRMYFCSYLCQELDSQYYKPKWGNAYVATEQNNNTYPRPYAENR